MIGKKIHLNRFNIGAKNQIVHPNSKLASRVGAKRLQERSWISSKENLNFHISNLQNIIDLKTLNKIGERLRSTDRFYIESLLHHSELQRNKFNSLIHPENKELYRENLQKLYTD